MRNFFRPFSDSFAVYVYFSVHGTSIRTRFFSTWNNDTHTYYENVRTNTQNLQKNMNKIMLWIKYLLYIQLLCCTILLIGLSIMYKINYKKLNTVQRKILQPCVLFEFLPKITYYYYTLLPEISSKWFVWIGISLESNNFLPLYFTILCMSSKLNHIPPLRFTILFITLSGTKWTNKSETQYKETYHNYINA